MAALVACVIAFLFGLWWNYKPVGSNASSSAPGYTLPKASGTTPTTTPSSSGASSGSTTTSVSGGSTTTVANGSTTTTVASGSTATSAPSSTAAGPVRVPMGPTQLHGNWTSPAFTTTVAGWNIGWAFSCTPTPASGPSFQVFVTTAGGSPSGTPAISETGASGQSITAQSTLGTQTLVVQAPAGCTWAVKVTGS